MAEIKREPVKIVIDGKPHVAFDADHTWSDIARWIAHTRADAEEMVRILGVLMRD